MSRYFRYIKRPSHHFGILICAAAVLSTTWTGVVKANMVGSDIQNFNPTSSGKDFVTVQSSETLGGWGAFSLGLWFNWATNTLPYFDQAGRENRDEVKSINDTLTSMDLVGALGITENWDIGFALPYVLSQSVKSEAPHGQLGSTGNTEFRLNSKYRVWKKGETGLALAGSANFNRLQNNPYVGDSSTPIFNLELIGDTKISIVSLGANLGYRFRKTGDEITDGNGATPIDPMKNQVIGSVAAGVEITEALDVIGEIYGGRAANNDLSTISPREASTMESILGLKYSLNSGVALHTGIGSELVHSISSPDLRVYAGVTWVNGIQSKPKEVKELAPMVVEEKIEPVEKVEPPKSDFPKADKTIVLNDVLFNFDSAQLNHKTASKNLDIVREAIFGPKGMSKIVIEGHTCNLGADRYNLNLSRRRAQAIKQWLMEELKIKGHDIITVGYGESRPVASNKNEKGRELNRRVEIKIYHADNPNFKK